MTTTPTPDDSAIINAVALEMASALAANTPESLTTFMLAAGERLVTEDPLWAYVTAKPGEPRSVLLPTNVAIKCDTFIYATSYQEVRVLGDALVRNRSAYPKWQLMPGMQENAIYPINPQAQKDAGSQ